MMNTRLIWKGAAGFLLKIHFDTIKMTKIKKLHLLKVLLGGQKPFTQGLQVEPGSISRVKVVADKATFSNS